MEDIRPEGLATVYIMMRVFFLVFALSASSELSSALQPSASARGTARGGPYVGGRVGPHTAAPSFSAPHYACTWSLQNYMALDLPQASNVSSPPFMGGGGNALAQAHLNVTYVLGAPSAVCLGCGWAETLHPRARSRMSLLLDAGWECCGAPACPDPNKFPPVHSEGEGGSVNGVEGGVASCELQLASLASGVEAQGWRGLGLWFGGVDVNATLQVLTTGGAGLAYLKIDGGDRDNVLTPLARALAPNMTIEHANGAGPINSGGTDGRGFSPADAAAWVAQANRSDTFRTYDVTQQLAIPTTLARVAGMLPLLDAIPGRGRPNADGSTLPRAILNAEDECILSVALMGACGVMRYPHTGLRQPDFDLFFPDPFPVPLTRRIKRKMDEIERALRWQDDFAPPYGAGDLSVWGGSGVNASLVDTTTLVDSYSFIDGSHWDAQIIGTTQFQSAPARAARGLPELPLVVASGLAPFELANASLGPSLATAVPYAVASRHSNGAFAVATLGRIDAAALWFFPLANVSLRVVNDATSIAGPFAIFGRYASLHLLFDSDIRVSGVARFLASDLLGGAAADITDLVTVSANGLSAIIPGSVIHSIGLAEATEGDSSDPGMLLVLSPPSAPVSQVDFGNVPLMPRVPSSYLLTDWWGRSTAFVNHILSAESAALGTTEVYTSTSAGASFGRRVVDVVTYVGTPPKRESFPPLETILTAAILGRRLDTGCSPLLDDCVATALQYANADGVFGHWVAPSSDLGPTVIPGGQAWDYLYSSILISSIAVFYPSYGNGILGSQVVANALRWHEALISLGGGSDHLDLNVSGFNFSSMTAILDPPIYRQPSISAGVAWCALAALEWNKYRNATAPPLPQLHEALNWSLAYLDALESGFFENLLGFGALTAARLNTEIDAKYDVGKILDLAFQDGQSNQKHGWGVFVDSWGGYDVSGIVGFVSEWDASQPYGAGGREAYFGDGPWLAAAVAPIARYNYSFAHAIGHWLVNICSASRLFFPDALPAEQQTDAGDPRNLQGVFPYEALRACDYIRELGNCSGSAAPFATGDYGCEFPTGSTKCSDPAPPCTNLAGYSGASVGILAALCAPTDAFAVIQADLLATDVLHAPAFPTFLVHNPHAETISVTVAVPGCTLQHWASTEGREGRRTVIGEVCDVVDSNSGGVLARNVAAPGHALISVAPDTAVVFECVPSLGARAFLTRRR